MRERRTRSWQRVTSRGRGVARAEGHKQGVIREAARIAGRGGTSRGRGGHKSRRSQARVRKQRSQARVHEREAAKVMAEGYKAGGVTRAEVHKQGVIREAVRIVGKGGHKQRPGGHKSRVISRGDHKRGAGLDNMQITFLHSFCVSNHPPARANIQLHRDSAAQRFFDFRFWLMRPALLMLGLGLSMCQARPGEGVDDLFISCTSRSVFAGQISTEHWASRSRGNWFSNVTARI